MCRTLSAHKEVLLLTERILCFQLSQTLASVKKSHRGWEEHGEDERMDPSPGFFLLITM